MTKPPPPASTASAIGPCPTIIQIVGRPGTGSLPSTIAPPDHPQERRKYVQSLRGRRGQNTEEHNPRNVSGRVVSPPLPLNAVSQNFNVQRELSPVLSAEADMSQVNEMEVQESTVFQFSQPYDDKTVLDEQTIIGGIPMPQHQSTVLEVQPQPDVNG